jgi:hypothetical protein
MQKSKHHWKRIFSIYIFVAVSVLIGVFISRYLAIQIAMQECDTRDFQAEEPPSYITAQLKTYRGYLTAFKYDEGADFVTSVSPVWIIDMKGKWLGVGRPRTEDGQVPEPEHFDQCTVVVYALRGDVFLVRADRASVNK